MSRIDYRKSFLDTVVCEVEEYAARYNCTFADSIYDWEGYGPDGGFGLTAEEAAKVALLLVERGVCESVDDLPAA